MAPGRVDEEQQRLGSLLAVHGRGEGSSQKLLPRLGVGPLEGLGCRGLGFRGLGFRVYKRILGDV